MNDYEKQTYAQHPLLDNPNVDLSKPYKEIAIGCSCGQGYRIYTNPEASEVIPVHDLYGISCPSCGAHTWNYIRGHSAGFFNSMIIQL